MRCANCGTPLVSKPIPTVNGWGVYRYKLVHQIGQLRCKRARIQKVGEKHGAIHSSNVHGGCVG